MRLQERVALIRSRLGDFLCEEHDPSDAQRIYLEDVPFLIDQLERIDKRRAYAETIVARME
jgi:anti-sigma factor ChrR (cupin superfamily)